MIVRLGLDAYTILLLFVILVPSLQSAHSHPPSHRVFIKLLLSTLALLLLEILTRSVNGIPGSAASEGNKAANMLLFSINPLPSLFWIKFVHLQLHGENSKDTLHIAIYKFMIVVNALLALASLFMPLLFSISAENIYSRGPWYSLTAALNFSGIILSFLVLIANHGKVHGVKLWSLALYPVLPGLGAAVQLNNYELTTIWSMTALGILMIFINIQSKLINTDYLTGLANRRQLDAYISRKILETGRSGGFSLIMLDIDNFKQINDRWGHESGDLALEKAAEIIGKSIRQRDFISRYAGDEFFIVLDTVNRLHLEMTVSRITSNAQLFNQENINPFKIEFSIGTVVYTPDSNETTESLKAIADKQMYKDKQKKKTLPA